MNISQTLQKKDLSFLEREHMKVNNKIRDTYLKFIKEFCRVFQNLKKENENIQKLMKCVNSNNLDKVKKYV